MMKRFAGEDSEVMRSETHLWLRMWDDIDFLIVLLKKQILLSCLESESYSTLVWKVVSGLDL